jgi:alginate O-acetyltransferase complex protein AlgI
MSLGVVLNVLLLVYFKYLDFFISTVNTIFSSLGISPLGLLDVALPIGVSFIVFEKITYLVDVYRGHGEPARSLENYLLYVLFFPKLLAGPIVKYHDIATQLINHRLSLSGWIEGFERFLLGLVKKMLVADTMGEIADTVFKWPPDQLGFGSAWLGVVCFTLQIYFDFSAYSDMAIGLARMFGFQLLENFNMPYIATSFTDFWRRWHISLSSWIREYLYFSLGGSRKGPSRMYFNLWLCFLISGLWHGANWTFVLWGAYNGVFLILDKLFWLEFSKRLPRGINIIITLFFVMIGWLLFRSTSLAQCLGFLAAMFNPDKQGNVLYITANVWVAMGVGIFLSLIPALRLYDVIMMTWKTCRISRPIEALLLSSVALLALAKAVTVTFNPFLYFRF